MAERVAEIARKGKARETASLAADAVGLADGTGSVYSSPGIVSAPERKDAGTLEEPCREAAGAVGHVAALPRHLRIGAAGSRGLLQELRGRNRLHHLCQPDLLAAGPDLRLSLDAGQGPHGPALRQRSDLR